MVLKTSRMEYLMHIPYLGGKYRMAKNILKIIKEKDFPIFIDAFGGSGKIIFSVLMDDVKNEKTRRYIYNDKGDIYYLFNILKNSENYEIFKDLYEKQVQIGINGDVFKDALSYTKECKNKNTPEFAFRYFLILKLSVGSMATKYADDKKKGFINMFKKMDGVHKGLQNVELYHKCYSEIFELFDNEDACIFCDPPYPLSKQSIYTNKFSVQDQVVLKNRISKLKGNAIITLGAKEENEAVNNLINILYGGFRKELFVFKKKAHSKKQDLYNYNEWVFCNW